MAKKTVTFLLKDIDRSLWGDVKNLCFHMDVTLQEFIIEAIREKLVRCGNG